jgi:tRNA 5-methylaminomethyl-2-thiouridine biosynthesis bifunctional protein
MPFRLTPAKPEFDAAGTPVSTAYGDIYFSPSESDATAQARHVFLGGNALPSRWVGARAFTILECGFGLGLNFLATWQAWRGDPQRCERLDFVSVEKHPFSREDLRSIHQRLAGVQTLSAQLLATWPLLVPGLHRLYFENGRVVLTLAFADIADAIADFRCGVDAFYLDGFAPDRNAEMWTPQIMKGLARLARPGATLATWCTAHSARAALTGAGFEVEKRPGFAPKRDMLAARFAPRWQPYAVPPPVPRLPERRAIVIGAGLAGGGVCERLATRGWKIELVERNAAPAQETSGLSAGVFHPHPAHDDNLLSRLTRAGFLFAMQNWAALGDAAHSLDWKRCGVLHVAEDQDEFLRQQTMMQILAYPAEFASCLSAEESSECTGVRLRCGGLWFPQGGSIKPATLVAAQLAAVPGLDAHYGVATHTLNREGKLWHVLDEKGATIASAPVVVLANAHDAARLADVGQTLGSLRGQLTFLPGSAVRGLRTVLTGDGYVIPAVDGYAIVGATTAFDDDDTDTRTDDHVQNLAALERLLPTSTGGIDRVSLSGAVGFRCVAPDRLPLIGAVPDVAAADTAPVGAHLADMPRLPGLFTVCAYGSRGLLWSALAGEVIADLAEGTPPVLEKSLADAVDPARFLLKQLRRAQA